MTIDQYFKNLYELSRGEHDLAEVVKKSAPVCRCGKVITHPLEREFFEAEGECSSCEHNRAEWFNQVMDDMNEAKAEGTYGEDC